MVYKIQLTEKTEKKLKKIPRDEKTKIFEKN